MIKKRIAIVVTAAMIASVPAAIAYADLPSAGQAPEMCRALSPSAML